MYSGERPCVDTRGRWHLPGKERGLRVKDAFTALILRNQSPFFSLAQVTAALLESPVLCAPEDSGFDSSPRDSTATFEGNTVFPWLHRWPIARTG